jgi:ATP-dependent Clp protease ATP-binding subunit ClpC
LNRPPATEEVSVLVEELTDQARRVVDRAVEATRTGVTGGAEGSPQVALLLALATVDTGVAAAALRDAGLTADRVRARFQSWADGPRDIDDPSPGWGEDVDAVLTLAYREATDLGHEYIGPEHLLLALLRPEDASVTAVLRDFGTSPAEVRSGLLRHVLGTAYSDPA